MLAAALAIFLAAAPVTESEDPEPQHIVWVHPLPAIGFGLVAPSHALFLPFGLTTHLGTETFSAGATVFALQWPSLASYGLTLSWHRGSGTEFGEGFFWAPKIFGTVWRVEYEEFDILRHPFEVGAGVDVGYQWRFGPVYVAPLLGAGASACVGCNVFPFSGPFFHDVSGRPEPQLKIALNLDLLRVGAAF